MKNLTTLQIGGSAKEFAKVTTLDELIEAIKYARQNDLNYLIIGGGSNLLVNDEGVNCLVIKNEIAGISSQVFDLLESERPRSRRPEGSDRRGLALQVKSGTILQELVDYTIKHGSSGIHKLTGIPGTLGGAVYGNAGAYGQTISDNIISVVVLSERSSSSLSDLGVEDESKDLSLASLSRSPEANLARGGRSGRMRVTLSKDECGFNYRDSTFKRNHNIILEVTFQLEKADPKILEQEAKDVLEKRLVKYPPQIKCPGSFFKNIVADTLPKEILEKIPQDKITYGKISAGYLLEKVGASGQRLDGIEIADYHANLFINKGGGTADAFYKLAKKYAQKVKQKFGITLEPEVQLINLPQIIV